MGAEKLLTDRHCKAAAPKAKVYRLKDGGGLFLLVRPDGARYFQYRYRHGGKERLCQIGPYPEVSLEAARQKLKVLRDQVREGKDPVMERRLAKSQGAAANATTFDAVAADWLAYHRPAWAANYHERNEGLIRRILNPAIGKLPVSMVPAAILLKALREAEQKGIAESARRARNVADQVFAWAITNQLAIANPARDLAKALRKPEVRHFAALPKDQLGDLLNKLDSDTSVSFVTRAALRLMLLTGLRDHELRAARWQEFDLDAGEWTVPAERMKRRIPHTVPIPQQGVLVLLQLHGLFGGDKDDRVFRSGRSKQRGYLAENTLRQALHKMGFAVTAHGIRSLLTDTLNELGFRHDWVEAQLHHAIGNKTTAAYKRTDFLDQRKKMMQLWADYCDARQAGKGHDEAAGAGLNVVRVHRMAA
jgi:integrase